MPFGISTDWNMGEFKNGYSAMKNGPKNPNEVKTCEYNVKAKVAIINYLSDVVFSKVVGLKFPKEVQEKLRSVYEGNKKTKQFKLTNLKHKFEDLRTSNDENIESYIHWVNESVSAIKGIGGKLEGSEVVRKVILTLPKYYNPKKLLYLCEYCH